MSSDALYTVEIDAGEVGGGALEGPAAVLRQGGLVAFPTETVYGVGADATDPEAVRRIFEAKERPTGHPLIVHVDGVGAARELVVDWPQVARRLAEAFWPGPLTMILPKSSVVPDVVTGGLETVGVRLPDHEVAKALVSEAGCPVAAPSANPHEAISPTRASHVERGLGERIDCLVDAGATPLGLESTVLDLSVSPPTILRPGMVPRRDIADALDGDVRLDDGTEVAADDAPRPSPGLSENHYAPSGELLLVDREELAAARPLDNRVGAVVRGEEPELGEGTHLVLPAGPSGFARHLYDALHELDASGCRRILVERPPEEESWRPVWNRLRRAASGRDPA